ncbi:hypothetical protein ACHWFR_26855, partial [Klebsiella pneumoniae]
LSSLISKFKNKEIDRNKLDSEFNDPSYLENAWLSYKKTFHHIYEIIDGEEILIDSRSTVPSEVFFSENVIVDIPLQVEFYKHLPGIITG